MEIYSYFSTYKVPSQVINHILVHLLLENSGTVAPVKNIERINDFHVSMIPARCHLAQTPIVNVMLSVAQDGTNVHYNATGLYDGKLKTSAWEELRDCVTSIDFHVRARVSVWMLDSKRPSLTADQLSLPPQLISGKPDTTADSVGTSTTKICPNKAAEEIEAKLKMLEEKISRPFNP